MNRTERTNNHGLFMQLLLALVMLFPINVWGQEISVGGCTPDADGKIEGNGIVAGEVTFDEGTSTLTLKNAQVTGMISSDITDLTVKLIGSSAFTIGSTDNLFTYTGKEVQAAAPTVTFSTEGYMENGHYVLGSLRLNDVSLLSSFTDGYYISNQLTSMDEGDVEPNSDYANSLESGWFYTTSPDGSGTTIHQFEAFDLWIGDGRVLSSALNGGKVYGPTYNPITQKLEFSTTQTSYSVKSSMSELVISVNDDCRIDAQSTNAAISFQTKGNVTSGTLKFELAEGADPTVTNKLLVTNDNGVISGFSDVTIDAPLHLVTPSAYPSVWDDNVKSLEVNDVINYGFDVTSNDGIAYPVTNKNRMNVLNDAGKSVQFDGVKTLLLNNAHLQEIDINEHPTFEKLGLTIFLKGTNVIDNDDDAAISYADYTPIYMTFSTTEVNGGQLTCSYDDFSYPFPNLEVKYKNFLLLSSDDANRKLIISQLIPTIVNEETKEVVLDGGGTGLGKDIKDMSTEELAAGVIVNKVLYLLGEDDGCAEDEDIVCLNSTDYDNDVYRINQEVIAGRITPGTSEFVNKSGFKGLIFLLPAGSGKIIIEYNTSTEGSLGVQIGKELHGLDEVSEMTTEEIPYILTTPSYVYIFSLDTDASRKDDALRAPGRKMTTTTHIRRVEIKADKVGCAPPPPLSPKMLTKADVDALIEAKGGLKYGDELTITDVDYTSIDDDALESFKSDNLKVTYLDLSQTSITGLVVDRKLPPFDRLIDGAFVYLPNGNDLVKYDNYVNINNVVIGDVCPYVLLPDNDNPFKLAKNFKAGYIEMERSFWPEYCTICLPFDATRTILENHTFYQIKNVVGNTITMEVVEQPKANVPYMLYPESEYMSDASHIVEFKKEIPEPTTVNDLTFVGTYETKKIVSSDTEDVFCFIDEGNFVRVKTYPITINPFRGYMTMPASSGSQVFNIDFGDETTGIKSIDNGQWTIDNWFDLSGRMVTNPKKGIFIQNGKKVIIK